METVRKLHNDAKRALIHAVVATGACKRALDVGCGRGGDLNKWKQTHVSHVDMCDPDAESLAEAKSRAKNMGITNVRFYAGDISACPNVKYDAVCYNFSLHYIFENEKLFFNTIHNIKKRLKIGGKLFGCIPDSDRLIMMKNCTMCDTHGNYFIMKNNAGLGNFGEKVLVFLADTPFFGSKPNLEPIAYKDLLITHLSNLGIILESWEPLVAATDSVPGEEITKMYSKFIFVNK